MGRAALIYWLVVYMCALGRLSSCRRVKIINTESKSSVVIINLGGTRYEHKIGVKGTHGSQ